MFEFQTISKAIEDILLKEKGSKFIGFAYPVNSESEIKEKLSHLRALHPKATHHCYAYRLGLNGENYRANDDGEPSGSAGRSYPASDPPAGVPPRGRCWRTRSPSLR